MTKLTLAFAVVAGLAAAAGVARHLAPAGKRRNVLSVLVVFFGLIAAFLLCFALGSLVRNERAQSRLQGGVPTAQGQPGTDERGRSPASRPVETSLPAGGRS